MPPTVQSASKERERKRGGEKRSELVCSVKYNNTLPDIPFDPKFITYPFDSTRFIQYNPTSLEKSFKYDLLTEHDLGVTIDLINPETYKINPNAYLEPEDERLLDEDSTSFGDQKRSRHNKMNVSWLRKTEYISTEYNRFTQKADKSETKVGYNIKKAITEDVFYKDKDSQIAAIEKTFDKAKEPITKHYSKPGVEPVEVLPFYPDFELWKHPFAQVIFDSDPAPKGRSGPALMEEMSQAMIRGAVDESGEHFVAYFLPTPETLGKRKRDEEDHEDFVADEEYDYTLAREYNWNVKNKLSRGYEETYFMVFRENGCFYNDLETRVRLSKRRKTAGSTVAKSRLVVKHRSLNDKELRAQDLRMMMLEPAQDEEEEEEEEEEFMQNANNNEDFHSPKSDDEGRRSRSRSRSSSRSGSGSRERSGSRSSSRSGSRSKSRSRSRSISRSHSRSKSRSRSRSRSVSRSRSRSRSGSRSGSGRSRSKSGSRSHSRSASRSRSRSRSGSHGRSASRSQSRSRSHSASRSGSEAESESEAEDRGKKDEEEIFGSASDSDSD
ncbi:RNA polymerase II-associated factor 1 homolog [Mercenaria mercenaria]|uniref:RNA polymerase II-associated factor 1 homolog n=1 Tax=Mercenaria mercenaria TaxID=6596 RepID=UPI001E1E1959|nr:RNA polymerase II-associated factor 1 homolog [Mercenaria mercenaria]